MNKKKQARRLKERKIGKFIARKRAEKEASQKAFMDLMAKLP